MQTEPRALPQVAWFSCGDQTKFVIGIIKNYESRKKRVNHRDGIRYMAKLGLGPRETDFEEVRERRERRSNQTKEPWEVREWRTQQEQKQRPRLAPHHGPWAWLG